MSNPIAIVPQKPAELEQRLRLQSSSAVEAVAAARVPTFALYTLGCKVNQSDSHQIARMLLQRGFRRVDFRECADLYVIDTCTVTAEADKKSRKIAGRAHRNNPDALIAVTGCAVASDAAQFRRVVPEPLLLDNTRKFELPELAVAALQKRDSRAREYSRMREQVGSEPMPSATRERAVLKIQDGCNHRCAFCIIPSVRGVSRTKTREVVLSEARALVGEGAREITVTGVSMGDWGRSTRMQETGNRKQGRNHELCSLLRELAEIEGLKRLRVSSLDPADVDEEFLQTVAHHPGLCPHIHLALQGGSARTLRRMRRRYTPELFLKWAKRWREIRPDGGLTTDIIVGFPGETEEDWQGSLAIAREAKFSAIHVFPYSPRAGTVAAGLENEFVSPLVQQRRVDELLAVAAELATAYSQQFIGHTLPVLIEKRLPQDAGAGEGMIPQYVKTRVLDLPLGVQAGDVVSVKMERWDGSNLIGCYG